jgi:hypothetical protein
MKREEIVQRFKASNAELSAYYQDTSASALKNAPEGKWDMTEHVIHLTKSMAPLNRILGKPRFFVRWMFGKPNRPSKTYDELVARYKERLALNTGGAPSPFVPKTGESRDRNEVITRFEKESEAFDKAFKKWKEDHLDSYILPHPLLGKVTLREMIYFMNHHTQHHLEIMKRNAGKG